MNIPLSDFLVTKIHCWDLLVDVYVAVYVDDFNSENFWVDFGWSDVDYNNLPMSIKLN